MNLAYYPFQLITTKPSEVTVIDTASPKVLTDLTEALRNDFDKVVLSNDQLELQEIRKGSLWVGDPILELDLDKLFQRLIYKKMGLSIEDRRLVELIDESQQLAMNLLQDPFLSDLPITVEPGGKLEQIMKYCNVHFDEAVTSESTSKIEALIQTLTKLEEKKLVILTNVSHYLSAKDFLSMTEQIVDTELQLVLIEFSKVNRKEYFEQCQYIYIDEDFVDSRELD
ncbi:type II-A CRISPR-associated protein Csn2 [Lacticaseibacillus paracasei]|uniref:type II-A CRISPR-associated protein Csn2 n=1 Tax=Lacticaseibacillus paracasei TaxID=1597 RepID=UPI0018913811|nr:type II-A CRISPR-associated protein Csn2 [Lacticaseibacillus paracasei]QPB57699.1 type II-A CRISPR-associated protein Csn2 [Lacticaseibacillus paracasei]WPQ30014.1 type II-A CRISPR-associated protein Csn2 [Lacticaseibacillus paracasei]